MLELHRTKVLDTGAEIKLFSSADEIVQGMNICLESISIIKSLFLGMEYG